MRKSNSKNAGSKKPYSAPKLTDYGSVKEFTRNTSQGTMTDKGGAGILTLMTCISPASALDEHNYLLADSACQLKFREAIFASVKPGDVVLDLGSGTGLHAFFAIQAGAKKVYAIESQNVIEIARQIARDNKMDDKVEFIYGLSTEIELPEKVDVIISNIGFVNTINFLPDARNRFLKPGGRCIPDNVDLHFVPVSTGKFYDEKVNFWSQPHYGLDLSAVRNYASQMPMYDSFMPENFMADPQKLTTFELKETPSAREWRMSYKVTKDGVMTGLLGWYSFELAPGVMMSTRPPLEVSSKIWSQPFMPFQEAVAVKAGQSVNITFGHYPNATLEGALWRWDLEVDGKKTLQSSFNAMPLSPELLQKLLH